MSEATVGVGVREGGAGWVEWERRAWARTRRAGGFVVGAGRAARRAGVDMV